METLSFIPKRKSSEDIHWREDRSGRIVDVCRWRDSIEDKDAKGLCPSTDVLLPNEVFHHVCDKCVRNCWRTIDDENDFDRRDDKKPCWSNTFDDQHSEKEKNSLPTRWNESQWGNEHRRVLQSMLPIRRDMKLIRREEWPIHSHIDETDNRNWTIDHNDESDDRHERQDERKVCWSKELSEVSTTTHRRTIPTNDDLKESKADWIKRETERFTDQRRTNPREDRRTLFFDQSWFDTFEMIGNSSVAMRIPHVTEMIGTSVIHRERVQQTMKLKGLLIQFQEEERRHFQTNT